MTEQQERKIKNQAELWEILHIADLEPTGGVKNEIYCKGCVFRREENNGCLKEQDKRWWYLFKKREFIEMMRNALPERACCVEKYLWKKND